MKQKSLAVLIIIGALAVMITVKLGTRLSGESFSVTNGSEHPIPVEAVLVTVGSMTEGIEAVGTLQAIASIVIRPEMAGVIRRIHFMDGQFVERGVPLIELDQEELQAQVHQAAAQERIAHVTYERLKRLSTQQTTIVPAQQVDEARLALQAAAANSVLYATRLKKAILRAPFSGTVGLRRVSVGDYVQPGHDMVNLEDLETLHVDFKVPEVWLSKLAAGQQLGVTTDAFPGVVFEGHVTAIDPRMDSVNRTVAVRAAVPNPERRLRPGLFATVDVTVDQNRQALLIPEEAVLAQRDRTKVFRIEDGTLRSAEVTIGQHQAGMVHVRSGLKEGDRIVRTGIHKLHDGMRVMPKESALQ
jgi:membrane fusion protein, multidrug efflux system